MTDNTNTTENNADTNQNNENNNENNNNTSGSKSVVIGCDRNNSEDSLYQDTVAQTLEQAGYEVEKLAIEPNAFATYSYESKAQGKIGIYLIAVGLTSIADLYSGGTSFDYAYFGIRGGLNGIDSMDEFNTKPIHKDRHGDCTPSICNDFDGKTYPQINEIIKSKCQAVFGASPDEMAQNLLAAIGGGVPGGGGSTTAAGGGVQIKDRTFEDCIRRICAATDSVFLVENNAAVLFPYTDWLAFTLREKIQTITAKEIDPDIFSMDYHNQGTYNKVTVTWGGNELPTRFEGQEKNTNPQQRNTPQRTRTTKKRHTTQTETTNDDNTVTLSEQYDALVDIYGEMEKRVATQSPNRETAQYIANALLIQYVREFNSSCKLRTINSKKYIGGTFYAVENIFTKKPELLFLNGYTMRTQKKEPLYVDLIFKYGPEGAEEILDLQTLTGIGSSGGGTTGGGAGGGESEDINQLAAQLCQGKTDELSKATAIHEWLRENLEYSGYSCSHYSSPTECLQHKTELNCADTSRLTRALMSAAGLKATVVHGPNHFWTVIDIGGKEYASDATSNYRHLGEVWQNLSYYDKNGDNPSC